MCVCVVYICVNAQVCVCAYMHLCVCTSLYVCVFMCMCVYVPVYMYVYKDVFVYLYTISYGSTIIRLYMPKRLTGIYSMLLIMPFQCVLKSGIYCHQVKSGKLQICSSFPIILVFVWVFCL